MQRTKIEYLTHTWNPIAMRCTPVSDGCKNCWHLAMAKRLAKNPMIDEDMRLAFDGGPVTWKLDEMEAPLHLRKPSRIGVQLMGDLFHESIKREQLVEIIHIIRQASSHTFFILTKRVRQMEKELRLALLKLNIRAPLPNLWSGVSIEDQKTADERIPILLQIPAAHRWVSVEPMLGQVNIPPKALCPCSCFAGNPRNPHPDCEGKPSIDWVVCGGETGPGARPLHPDWIRSIVAQCQLAGVPLFIKQVPINGKANKNMDEWPIDLRIRNYP